MYIHPQMTATRNYPVSQDNNHKAINLPTALSVGLRAMNNWEAPISNPIYWRWMVVALLAHSLLQIFADSLNTHSLLLPYAVAIITLGVLYLVKERSGPVGIVWSICALLVVFVITQNTGFIFSYTSTYVIAVDVFP